MDPDVGSVGFQVAAILRQYLATDSRNGSIDWQSTSGHCQRIAELIELLERQDLPRHGDPLTAIEMAWRAMAQKLCALDEVESCEMTSVATAERVAGHLRRWPSIAGTSEDRRTLQSGLFEIYSQYQDRLGAQSPVALDGVRAVLLFELATRAAIEAVDVAASGPECDILRRAIAHIDAACPDPLVEAGYAYGKAVFDAATSSDAGACRMAGRCSTGHRELDPRADLHQATSLEGAMVHLSLAFRYSGAEAEDDALDRCRQHIVKASRVLEAATGMVFEELGGAGVIPRRLEPRRPQDRQERSNIKVLKALD